MTIFTWQDLVTFDLTPTDAPVEVAGPWVVALELFGDATHLRLIADASSWIAMPGLPECDADGLPGLAMPDAALLLTDCAPAALVGRVGGSTASLLTPDTLPDGLGKPFVVGRHCVMQLPSKAVGPLFLGFNLKHRPVKVGALKVRISKAAPTFGS